jgi:heptosyltransferase-2
MEKILVIQTAFIGDAILTLPMIQKLKEMYPGSEIDVIAIPATVEIFSASSFIENVLLFDKRGEQKSLFALLKFIREIRKKKYTRIYSPHRSMRSALISMGSGVRESFGFDNSSLKHVYKNLSEYKLSDHEVKRNLDLAGYKYRNEEWKVLPEINISDKNRLVVDKFFESINFKDNIVAIAPGSIWNTKKYPKEYFLEIIKYLLSKSLNVVIVGGIKDSSLCEELAGNFNKNVVSSAGKLSLVESVELLRRCRLLISNDSAPAHLGVCADIPVLVLYCSTTAAFGFFPYNNRSGYLSFDNLSCKPCGIHGYIKCPLGHFACAKNLLPEEVINYIDEKLNGKK